MIIISSFPGVESYGQYWDVRWLFCSLGVDYRTVHKLSWGTGLLYNRYDLTHTYERCGDEKLLHYSRDLGIIEDFRAALTALVFLQRKYVSAVTLKDIQDTQNNT